MKPVDVILQQVARVPQASGHLKQIFMEAPLLEK
jgi:hypothetical protein